MSQTGSMVATVIEKFREFDRTASILDMPRSERLNVLNISEPAYSMLKQGRPLDINIITPELERRLSYALPMMRRMVKSGAYQGRSNSSKTPQLHAA